VTDVEGSRIVRLEVELGVESDSKPRGNGAETA
jgi:hypothetical protein